MKARISHAGSDLLAFANNGISRLGLRLSRVSGIESVVLLKALAPVDAGIRLIRIGAPGDGGYLVPDDLSGISSLFSPGVGEQASFERDCRDRGIRVHMADSNPRAQWASREFDLIEENLVPQYRADGIHLEDWVRDRADESSDLILQMDIEGDEWEVLSELPPATLDRFRVMVIEFHQLSGLGSDLGLRFARSVLSKLLMSFVVVHAHANESAGSATIGPQNRVPRNLEITFLRKDRVRAPLTSVDLPHELDEKSRFNRSRLTLPSVWFTND